MKNDDQKAKLPNMDMNNNPIWDVLDGKIEPRKKEKKKKLKKKSIPSIDENIDFYFSELEKEEQKENKPNNKKKPFSLFAIIMLLALIIVISFFALITFKYDRIKVQSDSMATQVTIGDQILYQSDLLIILPLRSTGTAPLAIKKTIGAFFIFFRISDKKGFILPQPSQDPPPYLPFLKSVSNVDVLSQSIL